MKPKHYSSLLPLLAGMLAGFSSRATGSGLVSAANVATVQDIFAAEGIKPEPAGNLAGGNGQGVWAANEKEIEAARARSVGAANDANLEGYYLSQPLTQFATDAPDTDGTRELLNAIAPPVTAGFRFSYQIHTEAEKRISDAIGFVRRAIGGEFPVITLTGTEAEGRLYNLGLTTFIDDDQGGQNPLVQQQAVMTLQARIDRAQLVHAIALIDAAATDVGSTNWGSSTSNPDKDGRADLRLAKLARGMKSNLFMFGDVAWLYRQDAYEQPARNNSGMKAMDTPESLARRLGVGRVLIAEETKRTSATALADIVGSATYNFMVNPTASPTDMSNVKRFTMMGSAGLYEVFIERLTKRTKVTVSTYANTIITSAVGIRKRTITYTEG